jgi:hypothetical protein
MANNVPLHDDGGTLYVCDYARKGSCGIYVRGSKFIDYDGNYFTPDAARRLARYILELADDADGKGFFAVQADHDDMKNAARKVSQFFDALHDEGFGPELTRQLTASAASLIVSDALYGDGS